MRLAWTNGIEPRLGAPPASCAHRIGILLHDFPAGGSERIAIRLANAWAAERRQVTIFCGSEAGLARQQLSDAVAVREAAPRIARGTLSRLRLGRALRAMLDTHEIDVLVLPGNFHLPILLAAGRLPCAVVCKLSNPLQRPGRGALDRAVFRLVTRLATRHADRLVAMAPALADEARQMLTRPIETIAEPILTHGGVLASRWPDAAPLVVCAGRMVPQKDFSLALKAFALIDDGAARLVLLGDGPDRPCLEAEAAALGLTGRVLFEGHVPDIAPYLARAGAFLLSSRYEGYPAVLVEAIGAGVPVVTTVCSPAIGELLSDASFGFVVDRDPRAVARGLRKALRRGIVNEAARQRFVTRHLVEGSSRQWLSMLDRVVASRATTTFT